MKILRESGDRRNMYELVYSKQKTLKDDNRLTYFSFNSVIFYPEMRILSAFAMLNTAASGINTIVVHALETKNEWPFAYYSYGAASGMVLVIVVSDFIFQ